MNIQHKTQTSLNLKLHVEIKQGIDEHVVPLIAQANYTTGGNN
jgi:hypothetical protein